MNPYDAIIFDMDGLIVDTESIYYNTYNQTLKDQGAKIAREGYVPCVGHPVEKNSEDAVAEHSLSISPEEFLITWMTRFESAIEDPEQIDLMPGFLNLFAHIQKQGYHLGIASSTPRHRMETTLKNGVLPHLSINTLDEAFGTILSGSDVTHTKPDPEIYLKAAAALNVEPEKCVVFEDSIAGVQSGKAAEMTVFAVPNFFTAHQDHTIANRILKSLSEAIPLL